MDSPTSAQISDLVTFAAPPVNEVVLSVQFDSPVIDEFGMLARFWPAIQTDFPKHSKQPPLPPVQEDFQRPPSGGVQFQFLEGPPLPRYWFIAQDEAFLVQVQTDRFALNWRQLGAPKTYPRYRTLRPEFERRFETFMETAGSGDPMSPTWCEVTYINHVDAVGSEGGAHGPLSRVLRALDPNRTTASLPPVEDTQLQQRFVITRPDDDEPVGRLYLTATPAFRNDDGEPIYVLTLMARGKPAESSLAGVLEFFDRGRDLIVKGFKESTTDEMHERWGLRNADG